MCSTCAVQALYLARGGETPGVLSCYGKDQILHGGLTSTPGRCTACQQQVAVPLLLLLCQTGGGRSSLKKQPV